MNPCSLSFSAMSSYIALLRVTESSFSCTLLSPQIGGMFLNHCWQVLINLLFAIFGNFQSCQNWQLQKLPKLATSEAAKTGNFRSCQNWQLQKLPKLATSEAAKTGNFRSCQNWQLQKLPKLATFRAASKMYH